MQLRNRILWCYKSSLTLLIRHSLSFPSKYLGEETTRLWLCEMKWDAVKGTKMILLTRLILLKCHGVTFTVVCFWKYWVSGKKRRKKNKPQLQNLASPSLGKWINTRDVFHEGKLKSIPKGTCRSLPNTAN